MLILISMIIITVSLAIISVRRMGEKDLVLNLVIFLNFFLIYTLGAMVVTGYILLFIQSNI